MKRFFWIFIFCLANSVSHISVQARPGESYQIEPQCDLADVNLNSQKARSSDECSAGCQKSVNCRAFVYVSGWNRCFLKSSSKKKTKIRFFSSEVVRVKAKKPRAEGAGYDQDHSGKDLERKIASSPEQCQQSCFSRADCMAFTFIEGYDVCWLKASGGRLLPKIFYCGIPK